MDIFDACERCVDWVPGEYVYGENLYVSDYYMNEHWKPYLDFPEYYVSDHGRVWSSRSNQFIYGTKSVKCGHIDISLKVDGVRHHRYLHRMVAETFIPNPNNYPMVRHLDDDPSNNSCDNLAWGTQKDNMQDAITNGRFKYFTDEDREKAMQKRRKPVIAINVSNGKEVYFESQQEASRQLNVRQGDISRVVSGNRRIAKGYIFKDSERRM